MVVFPVVFASDLPKCECCDEPWCPTCSAHYHECNCLGPSEAEDLGYELFDLFGKTYAAQCPPQPKPSSS